MDYRAALETLIAELRTNPRIEVIEATLHPGASPERLAAFALRMREGGIDIPPAILELYAQVNGFKLVWEPRRGVTVPDERTWCYPDGRMPWSVPPCYTEVHAVESLLDRHREVGWDLADDAGDVTAGTHFLVDHDQEEQGTWLACMDGAPSLFYVYNQGEDVEFLGLSFDAFFERFLAFRGFFCWQEMLRPSSETHRGRTDLFDRWMPVLFPPVA